MKKVFHKTIFNEASRRSFLKKIAAVATVFASPSCKKDPKDTIANLKVAITAEININATYTAFSEKAKDEGYRNIANMFRAAAFAETIHANNHNAVLKKLGEQEFRPTAVTPTVNSTQENLQTAIDGETYEYTEMYPGFLATAKKEDFGAAIDSFTWANLAEGNHASEFSEALRILQAIGSDEILPSKWFICEQCGGMFTNYFTKCLFCRAETDRQHYIPKVFDANTP